MAWRLIKFVTYTVAILWVFYGLQSETLASHSDHNCSSTPSPISAGGNGSIGDLHRKGGGGVGGRLQATLGEAIDTFNDINTFGDINRLGGVGLVRYEINDTSGWHLSDPAMQDSPLGGWITDPVVVDTGEFTFEARDMYWPHDGTFVAAERLYRHKRSNTGVDFGTSNFHTNLRIVVDESINQLSATVNLGNGEDLIFTRPNSSTTNFSTPSSWERYRLIKAGNTQYELTDKNGYKYTFAANANPAKLIKTATRYSTGENYTYDGSGYLTLISLYVGVTSPHASIYLDRDVAHAITAIRDYAGRTVNYAYDGSGRLTHIEDACGACSTIPTADYVYDGSDRITAVKDADGNTARSIVYDGSNRVSYYVDANSGTYQFTYSGPNYVIDAEGSTTAYSLDGSGNATQKILGYGSGVASTFAYQYDGGRRITQATLPNGAVIDQTYDARGNVLTTVVTAGGTPITKFRGTYESTFNQPLTRVDALGNTTTYSYDGSGSMTLEVRPGALSSTFQYDSMGLLTEKVDSLNITTGYSYTSDGFLESEIADKAGAGFETNYTVDSLGRALTSETPESRISQMEFNASGKLTSSTSAKGIVTEYEYDSNGRRTAETIMNGVSPLFAKTMSYDIPGRLTEMVDPGLLTTTFAYDLNGRNTRTTDPSGWVKDVIYDAVGRAATLQVGDGSTMLTSRTLVYDNMNNVVTSTDGSGNATILEYDGFGRRTKVTDTLGHYTTYGYDDLNQQTFVKRYNSGSTLLTHTVIEYDALGRQTKVREKAAPGGADGSSDGLTEMVYDSEGHLVTKKVYVGSSTHLDTIYAYDGAGRETSMTDPDGKATSYYYDDDGNRTTVADPKGHQTIYAYDDDGHVTQVTTELGHYTVSAFDERGLQTAVGNYNVSNTLLAKTTYVYDGSGRLCTTRRKSAPGGADNNATDFVEMTFYDGGGKVTKRTSAIGQDTTYAYDIYGRQTLMTLPDGSHTDSSYDSAGVLTSQIVYEIVSGVTKTYRTDYTIDDLNRVTAKINQGPDGTFGNGDDLTSSYVYDGAGRLATTTDEGGKSDVIVYDALNRKTRMTEDSGGIGRVTDFTYDRSGRMENLIAYTNGTSGAQTTHYAYNGRGLQTTVTYEVTGDVSMAYDDGGQMTRRIDEAGITVNYLYDNGDLLTQREKNSATTDIEKYVYDGLGRLVTAKKGTNTTDDAVSKSVFAYDNLSRVTSEVQAIAAGTAKTASYTYDKAGNRISLVYPGGGVTATYAYDTRDRCTQISKGGSVLADYVWLGSAISKREVTCDYPGATKPKFRTDFPRDGLLRVTAVTNKHLTTNQSDSGYDNLGSWTYSYDTASNPSNMVHTGAAMDELASTQLYTYDTLNRLLTAKVTDTANWTAASQKTTWYSYDDVGNRISHQYRDGTPIGYAHDAANRMTGLAAVTQGYDLAGNLTLAYSADRGTSYQYKYDHHNRLTGIYDSTGTTRKAAFTWDALGRRIEFVNDVLSGGPTTRYYYDGVNEIAEFDGSNVRQRYYVHGISYIDERLMMYNDAHARPYYYALDRMYNVRAIIDRAGSIVERYVYDPYGWPLIRESAGRGDMDDDTDLDSTDLSRLNAATRLSSIWDARADLDDDGDQDNVDFMAYGVKDNSWPPASTATSVAQAYSDVGNPFMFQGVPHFAIDTSGVATDGKLLLNHHRARFNDPVIGRWVTRDPLFYNTWPFFKTGLQNLMDVKNLGKVGYIHRSDGKVLYVALAASPTNYLDPSGYIDWGTLCAALVAKCRNAAVLIYAACGTACDTNCPIPAETQGNLICNLQCRDEYEKNDATCDAIESLCNHLPAPAPIPQAPIPPQPQEWPRDQIVLVD